MGDSGQPPAQRRYNRTEEHMTRTEMAMGWGAPFVPGNFISEQTVTSLKVTIQQSSDSREFRQMDESADRQSGGLHCHVCDLTCRSLQVFQEHMAAPEHLKNVADITGAASSTARRLHNRGRRPNIQRWCDTCQAHFSSDVITHRQTREHKECKKQSRPFCPVCHRHFKTPRKFVEHMKSEKHKQQVHLQEQQEEELITVDAIGCFKEEEEPEEVQVILSQQT
ncbi:cdkn1a interacting zinc finger protein 1b isoform X1 [Takifugu flavidus]|uniref:cdkn1a interacting zinc finger protein 1b isoform X1 n=1 Tax=Takifugu flavidus TaxID=433684 RepID=UPI0025448A49|nr:cdkn1a interacting zinc finger protein 1b isoform X1 [Takifugu flavidus]